MLPAGGAVVHVAVLMVCLRVVAGLTIIGGAILSLDVQYAISGSPTLKAHV
jgi:hypothetical protein